MEGPFIEMENKEKTYQEIDGLDHLHTGEPPVAEECLSINGFLKDTYGGEI